MADVSNTANEPAGDGIVFRNVWQQNDARAIRDTKALWSSLGIPTYLIEGHENELCAVAYSGEQLAAIALTSVFYHPWLRNKFFAYRSLTAPQFRKRMLAWRIGAYSFGILQEWSAQHPEERILGTIQQIETDKFREGLRKPVRSGAGITLHFAGYNPNGDQVRVAWFDHAELDDETVKREVAAEAAQRRPQ